MGLWPLLLRIPAEACASGPRPPHARDRADMDRSLVALALDGKHTQEALKGRLHNGSTAMRPRAEAMTITMHPARYVPPVGEFDVECQSEARSASTHKGMCTPRSNGPHIPKASRVRTSLGAARLMTG